MPDDDSGRELSVYSHAELIEALAQVFRDNVQRMRLLAASRRIWSREGNQSEDLLQQAVLKLLRYTRRGGTVRKDIALSRVIIRYMRWVALDYLKNFRRHRDYVKETSIEPEPVVEQSPDVEDVKTEVFELGRQYDAERLAQGKTGFSMTEYLRLRFERDLEGEEIRAALALSEKEFVAAVKAAQRLLKKVKEAASE